MKTLKNLKDELIAAEKDYKRKIKVFDNDKTIENFEAYREAKFRVYELFALITSW